MTPKNYFIHWIKRCIIEITNGLAEQQRPEAQARKEQENNDLGKRRSRPFALSLSKGRPDNILNVNRPPFMVRQAERVLLGRMPRTATAYPLRVHHERRT